jgi:hypothetical protein
MSETQGVSAFKGFQSPQVKKIEHFFQKKNNPMCSQEYRRMIKYL